MRLDLEAGLGFCLDWPYERKLIWLVEQPVQLHRFAFVTHTNCRLDSTPLPRMCQYRTTTVLAMLRWRVHEARRWCKFAVVAESLSLALAVWVALAVLVVSFWQPGLLRLVRFRCEPKRPTTVANPTSLQNRKIHPSLGSNRQSLRLDLRTAFLDQCSLGNAFFPFEKSST